MHQDYKSYDFKKIEEETRDFWKENDTYRKTKEKKGKKFYFNDGPPYVTGSIHVGTAFNKIVKDCVIRHLRMQGYNVRDQPGYDMHGLPIEVRVEQSLGIKNKKDIEKFGVEKFIEKCKEFALNFEKQMTEEFKKLGVWMDWNKPYETIRNDYIDGAWWLIKKAHEKGLLERSLRTTNWCPRCETALADAEVEYGDKEDYSIYVKMPLKDGRFIIIWTTTPWTVPANEAIAANPNFEYSEIEVEKDGKTGTERWILIHEEEIVQHSEYRIKRRLKNYKGRELEGLEYDHPLKDLIPHHRNPKKVFLADFVTGENSGFVHIAPGHGEEDFELGKKCDIEVFCPVDGSGHFTEDAGKYSKKNIFDANKEIIGDLEERNFLVSKDRVLHRYGFCWRCKTPIIYRTTEQWFLKVEQLKGRMIDEVKRVKWYPKWAGSSREMDWVKNARNWCISRQRYWGIPLPIWKCDNCGSLRVIGSKAELKKVSDYGFEELHRPWIDSAEINCEKCGKKMKRIPDVQDVWLDSGVSSWAQISDDERDLWPPELIIEAHDQTRGWFYSQLGAGVVGFDRAPYNRVMMHGWFLDEEGKRMSKSLGNVVNPLEVMDKYGCDSFRFYVLSCSAPWDDKNFSWKGVENANRFMNLLWNVYVFATSYMTIDGFNPPAKTSIRLENEDRWIYSRMENLKLKLNGYMENYELHKVCREIENFVSEDLSRFYIRLIRDRVWVEKESESKNGAYKTLYDILLDLSKLLAPITPHIAERVYTCLSDGSVHMEDWPSINESKIDPKLEEEMDIVKGIIEGALRGRQRANLKVRWPLKQIIIESDKPEVKSAVSTLGSILSSQINCKEIEICDHWSGKKLMAKPDRAKIGRTFRGDAKNIISRIEFLIEREGPDKLQMLDEYEIDKYKIGREMVIFEETLPDRVYESDFDYGKIYIDAEITEEIKAEGFARELIRRTQEMRKHMDLEIEDYIECNMLLSTSLKGLLGKKRKYIANETRAKKLSLSSTAEATGAWVEEWNIEGERVKIGITRLKNN